MAQCDAKAQYSGGKQCQREALSGRSKCAGHSSGGCRSAAGRAAIAAARSKGLGDTRAYRKAYQAAAREMFVLAQLAGITYIGRIPNGALEDLKEILDLMSSTVTKCGISKSYRLTD